VIPSGTGGGGAGGLAFPDPPKGDPGGITAAGRSLSKAADDLEGAAGGLRGAGAELEADWQGYAAAAYHSSSGTLAAIARGAGETFRDCAHAVTGYATALDHTQSEIKRLRHLWEDAKHRQGAAQALAGKLAGSITATTKPADATRLSTQAGTCQGQADDAGGEADRYALRATTELTEFKQKASGYESTLEGYQAGHAPGPFGSPFTAPGTPGRTFGLPSNGFDVPGTPGSHSLDPYNGVLPVGDPWNSPIPGYGYYKDATTPEAVGDDDLLNLALLVSSLGGGAVADLGANALKGLAERLGIGALGKGAAKDAAVKAYEDEVAKAIASGEGRHSSFANILKRATDAGLTKGAETKAEQSTARADLVDALLEPADQAGVLPDGVKDVISQLAHNGWAFTSYTTAKLVGARASLAKIGTPAAELAARVIGTILRTKR
jgi:uncharacterized protein YukE